MRRGKQGFLCFCTWKKLSAKKSFGVFASSSMLDKLCFKCLPSVSRHFTVHRAAPLSPMHTPLVPGCHLSVTAGTELIPGHRQAQEQGFSTELRCLMRMGQMLSKGTSVSVVVRTNTTSCKATLISFFILQ